MAPNIPAAKRAGLPVDLERLTVDGDSWLSPEERYALKMHGVCAQAQPGVFMIRTRTGGVVDSDTARGLADIADEYARGWIRITTRQQVEFHHVQARDVNEVLRRIRAIGLVNRSSCGHTMRGVMSCPDAGVGLEEPFDCHFDAQATSDYILSLQPDLDTKMPQRINIGFGGCLSCREHARLNDMGFVSKVTPEGELGYELWLAGSLGKSTPTLAIKAVPFLPRREVLPAVAALFEMFVEHGDFDNPGKARLKYLMRKMGEEAFLELFFSYFEKAKQRSWPEPHHLSTPLSASLGSILACAPEDGWGGGVRPQRLPGFALVTVNVPLGDLDTEDWRLCADLAADLGDDHLHLTKNQNVMFRHVPLDAVPAIRKQLSAVGLGLEGADHSRDIRVCTGGPVCSLALTPAQKVAAELLDHPALHRNSALRIHVSGCPAACAQHQIADIGFSGSKVTIAGVSLLGYQVWLGGDVGAGNLAQVVGRVAEQDAYAITGAIVGLWEALRERGENFTTTVHRLGTETFAAQIAAVFKGQWEPGAEPANDGPIFLGKPDRRQVRMVVGA